MRSPKSAILITLAFSLLLSACNLPRAGKNVPTDTVLTVAAKTVQAQLTVQAGSVTPAAPATLTPPATATNIPPSRTPQPLPTQVYIPCDRAEFINDVTIPDGTKLGPNASFLKTWRLRNNGTCTWTTAYSLVFDGGESMGGPAAVGLPASVAPGESVDISVNLKSPATPGKFKGFWKLRNTSGATFGIGYNANVSFWVEIEVVSVTPTVTVTSPAPLTIYDLANNYCAATWVTGAGTLPCPGTSSDANGFVIRVDNPTLQDNVLLSGRALETHPQFVDNSAISGRFPPLDIQSGYHFKARLGCLNGGAACDVIFQLNYRIGSGSLQNLGTWSMKYADSPKDVDVDLSTLAGQSVDLILAVASNGPSNQDWAVWFKPVVVK